MRFGPVALDDALGATLAHSVAVGARRLAKGRVLGEDDIAAARGHGVTALVVARLETGDIAEDDAAACLAAALAGAGVAVERPAHGRVNLAATAAGIVVLEPAAIDAINAIDPRLTLGTLRPFDRVEAGQLVATIKIIPFAVPSAVLAAAGTAARPIVVERFIPASWDLIQTVLPGGSVKPLAKMRAVTAGRAAAVGAWIAAERRCAHEAGALAALLADPGGELILIAGASATTDEADVIPEAIRLAGGEVRRVGMPVDPGNLLVLGRIGERPVLGLPGCARSPKRNGVDWVIERLAAGLCVTSDDIARMGVGGLIDEAPRPARAGSGTVGAILLAAGRSTRMGAVNKLTAELGGRAMVAHAANAALAAGLPLLVVLGHAADAVAAALPPGTRTVFAADHGDGLARSLAAGVAAAPAEWAGAVVLLGDMPAIDAATIRAVAAALDHPAAIAVATHDGGRGNPVGWGRAHFARLAALTGDVGGKALLSELASHVREVPGPRAVLADIDTPAALAAARAGHAGAPPLSGAGNHIEADE